MNLEEEEIGVVVLGDFAGIREGMEVRRTGKFFPSPSAMATWAVWSTRWANRLTAWAKSQASTVGVRSSSRLLES